MARHAAATEQAVAALHDLVVVDRRRMLRVVVAALTEERQLRDQHAVVAGSVRIVARRATLAVDAGVFKQPRAALLGVTRRARLVDRVAGLQQLDVGGAVRVMA